MLLRMLLCCQVFICGFCDPAEYEHIYVTENAYVVFDCDSDSPVEWSRQNNVLPRNHLVRNNKLIFPSITADSSGVFLCKTRDNKIIIGKILKVEFSPKVSLTRPTLKYHNDLSSSNQVYVCTVHGYPLALPIWYINGTEITNTSDSNITYLPSTDGQTESRLTRNSTGEYDEIECRAKNKIGEGSDVIKREKKVPETQDNNVHAILWPAVLVVALLVFVIIYVKKNGCHFALFSSGLHASLGTQGGPDDKGVIGEDGKDERAGSDGNHRMDGNTNGGPDPEGPARAAELNGIEGLDGQPKAPKLICNFIDDKDERAGSDGNHRMDGNTNRGPDPEGPARAAELNGIEGQDGQPEAPELIGPAGQNAGGMTQRDEETNVTNQYCLIQIVNFQNTGEGALSGQDQEAHIMEIKQQWQPETFFRKLQLWVESHV